MPSKKPKAVTRRPSRPKPLRSKSATITNPSASTLTATDLASKPPVNVITGRREPITTTSGKAV